MNNLNLLEDCFCLKNPTYNHEQSKISGTGKMNGKQAYK